MVVQCCSCKKVREGQAWGDSIDPDLARAPVSHTYCPVCAKRVIEALQDLRDAKRTMALRMIA